MKTSEAANLAFQWIFVLNSVKQKFFHVSVVKRNSWKIPVSEFHIYCVPISLAETQLTFTCSNSAKETLEKCVKHVQSYR